MWLSKNLSGRLPSPSRPWRPGWPSWFTAQCATGSNKRAKEPRYEAQHRRLQIKHLNFKAASFAYQRLKPEVHEFPGSDPEAIASRNEHHPRQADESTFSAALPMANNTRRQRTSTPNKLTKLHEAFIRVAPNISPRPLT